MKPNNFFNDKIRWEAPVETGAAPETVVAPVAAPVEAADYSFIPADFIVDGKPDVAKFQSHYQEMLAEKTQRGEIVVPEAYDFAVPADVKFDDLGLPEGFTVELDAKSEEYAPLFKEFGDLLKGLGAPAEAAQKATGMLARYEAVKAAREYTAWAADMKTLGSDAQAKARVDVVQRKLETVLPADQVKAIFSGERISATGIKALEKLLAPKSFGTTPTAPANASLEGLSPYERLKAINSRQMRT